MSAPAVTRLPATGDERYMAVAVVLSRYGVRMRDDRMAALIGDILAAVDERGASSAPTPVPDPTPPPAPSRDERAKAKNPTATTRECSRCGEVKGTDAFYWSVKKGRKTPTPSSACKACVSSRSRERYLSTAKLDALNAARLEFTADADEAGLLCVDCRRTIAAGEQVVAESGLHHTACVEASA